MAYDNFAQYYDVLTKNIDYGEMALKFQKLILQSKTSENNILLDLACGTGSLSVEFAKLGYDVIGVDISDQMLSAAIEKKYDNELDIQFILQDMRKLDLYGTIGAVVCGLDSLNHLSCLGDVAKVFQRASLFTEKGGVLVFDMNTPYKHKEILASNIFIYDTQEVYCVWENTTEGDTVTVNLEFFEHSDGVYLRSSESFCEYAYALEDIKNELEKAHFSSIEVYDAETLLPPTQTTQRWIFSAVKAVNSQII